MMGDKITPRQVAIDFDGTLARHSYPMLGAPVPEAIRVVKRLKSAGHILILQTMRADDLLQDAVKWCEQQGLKFDYVNCNPMYETGSRKIYSHCSIDDHNLGISLIHDHWEQRKPMVDWMKVEKILEEKGYL